MGLSNKVEVIKSNKAVKGLYDRFNHFDSKNEFLLHVYVLTFIKISAIVRLNWSNVLEYILENELYFTTDKATGKYKYKLITRWKMPSPSPNTK